MSARGRIAMLADQGTFRELDRELVSVDPLHFMDLRSYRERLREARKETGMREAVTTGLCRIGGERVVLVVFDFHFLGGTMGSVVGEKIANAFEKATKHRIPLVSVTASGGARVQEGMLSLMQMAKVAAAASRHNSEGLAFVSILCDPTFGGVTASFASLGDIIVAEPGAQIGFVGPRVIKQTTGIAPPADSHRAETLLDAGLIDLVVARKDLRTLLVYLLSHLKNKKFKSDRRENVPRVSKRDRLLAWQHVSLARHAGRPTASHYIAQMSTHFLELHGDRWGGDDRAIIGGIADIDGETVVIIAQERGETPKEKEVCHGGMAFPEGYRKASRLMQLAAKFRIPVITLIDTPGAQATYESERRGIAHALATNLAAMVSLPTPIVSAIIGQGGSGGAIALGVADRVLMLEHAIYSVISPEAAASILYRDIRQAEGVSERLKITARDLLDLHVIDTIVPEPKGGAHLDPDAAANTLKINLLAALRELRKIPARQLLAKRYEKYRHIGQGGIYWREQVRTAISGTLGVVRRLLPGSKRIRKSSSAG
jgi:acetyl-CoA carboxylase carboxyl transferase subunit beta